MEISGHTAVVTGGASGLGEATVRLLHSLGGNVVVMDLQRDKGEDLCGRLGSRAHFAHCDVTVTEQVQAALKDAVERFGAVHFAVNCAGGGVPMRVLAKDTPHDLNVFQKVVNLNLVATFDVIRWAAFYMAKNAPNDEGERGVIVNTASIAAFEGQIGQPSYSASKAGIVGMTLPIARDLARYGIRVCTIAPGIFDTPLLGALPEDVRASLAKQMPFPQRLGKPHEFAILVRHIIENPMLNGETIRLDGALRMGPR
jgi:NAD(P)-dependent dehydrogenase (short-subunit alcohol dehydrogenase family)